MANDKATSEARCKLKGKKSSGVPPRKKAQGNNSNSIVTIEQGQGSEPKHQSPADHPLFGVRRYVHKNHNASNPVLHVKVTDHLSYKESEDEDEEDEVLMKKSKTKSPPPNPKGKEAVVKTKCKGGEVHTKEKAAAIKSKGKASPKKRKISLPEPESQPISKRLRKKT